MLDTEKIISLTEEELLQVKFVGADANPHVAQFVTTIRLYPRDCGWVTVAHVHCLDKYMKYQAGPPPSSESTSERSSKIRDLDDRSSFDAGHYDYIPLFERKYFYNGISEDPPPLFQRSDRNANPFAVPGETPNERFYSTPIKAVHPACHPVLTNLLWKYDIAPKIIAICQEPARGISISTMIPVRFATIGEDDQHVLDDYIVLWISVNPRSTSDISCRNANTPILDIFQRYSITDVVVHWIEGSMESLASPPEMLPVVPDTNATHWIRRALTAVLGVPLAAKSMEDDDSQGSLGLFFHRGKDRAGNKSKEVLALTNKHVVSKNLMADYSYSSRTGARKEYIRNCGNRRFARVLQETTTTMSERLDDAKDFAIQLNNLIAQRAGRNNSEDDIAIELKKQDLQRARIDVTVLDDFLKLLKSTWSDPVDRVIGWVDWAPKLANDLDERKYTRDLGVITLESDKINKNFKGNVVYLGGKYSRAEINKLFYPNTSNPQVFVYPPNHLFQISGFVKGSALSDPYYVDENNRPSFTVAKDGQTTDLTFGRQSDLESYSCRELYGSSWEVAIFNWGGHKYGDFSKKGDSGSAIFNVEGKVVALLHSGNPHGLSNHITYGTPGHFIKDLILQQYPDADFSRSSYD